MLFTTVYDQPIFISQSMWLEIRSRTTSILGLNFKNVNQSVVSNFGRKNQMELKFAEIICSEYLVLSHVVDLFQSQTFSIRLQSTGKLRCSVKPLEISGSANPLNCLRI